MAPPIKKALRITDQIAPRMTDCIAQNFVSESFFSTSRKTMPPTSGKKMLNEVPMLEGTPEVVVGVVEPGTIMTGGVVHRRLRITGWGWIAWHKFRKSMDGN